MTRERDYTLVVDLRTAAAGDVCARCGTGDYRIPFDNPRLVGRIRIKHLKR